MQAQTHSPGNLSPLRGIRRRITAMAVLGIAVLCLGLVGNQAANAGAPAGAQGGAVAGSKLYGQLKERVARADPNARLRVIVHMRD